MLEFTLYYFICKSFAAQVATSTPLSSNGCFSFKICNSTFACSTRIVLGYSLNNDIAYDERARGNLTCFATLK